MNNRITFRLEDTTLGWAYLNGYWVKGAINLVSLASYLSPVKLTGSVFNFFGPSLAQKTGNDTIIQTTKIASTCIAFFSNPVSFSAMYVANEAGNTFLDSQWDKLTDEQKNNYQWKEFFAGLHITKMELAVKVANFADQAKDSLKLKLKEPEEPKQEQPKPLSDREKAQNYLNDKADEYLKNRYGIKGKRHNHQAEQQQRAEQASLPEAAAIINIPAWAADAQARLAAAQQARLAEAAAEQQRLVEQQRAAESSREQQRAAESSREQQRAAESSS